MADNVSTRNVWPNYHQTNVQTASKRNTGDTMGKDQFLKILVTQLSNQDPMQPMQDRDFIAQMAQFTSVEQLMNMSGELALLRQSIGSASSLIGKTISWNEYNESGDIITHKGVVDSIISKDGLLFASVGTKEIALDYVLSIAASSGEDSNDEQTEQSEPEQSEVDNE